MMQDRYVKQNYLKWLDLAIKHFVAVTDVTESELRFMLYVYDYEFFTVRRIAKDYGRSKKKLYDRTVLPLQQKGYLMNYFNHGRVKVTDAHLQLPTQEPARISLSHKGRHAVQRFYRMINGDEAIAYNYPKTMKVDAES